MNLSVGIIGLPNVGKSTLFNALLKKQAALAANYPFATIEPNVGVVPVPDERLEVLADIVAVEMSTSGESPSTTLGASKPTPEVLKRPPIVPAVVQFVDIAGLVKGASEGAGLGNKFLSHIREVRIIAHVVRAFEDPNVVKEGSVDPKTDYETIRTELALSDLSVISNIKNKKANIQIKNQIEILERIEQVLNNSKPFDSSNLSKEEEDFVRQLNLLSGKPEIVVLNVAESDYTKDTIEQITQQYFRQLEYGSNKIVVICARIEEELAVLSEDEQKQYLLDLGLEESGLERLIKKAYRELGLISFLTAGEKEVRAWTIRSGTTAQNAAGEIHTDFVRNFIKAEVVKFEDFISNNGWKASREKGKARFEGKDYIMQDGDVVEFRIGR
ncbi:MAG: redox-regulated ATPase YchF [Candidatus Levybacteria bacterium RIFCSPLOWO2_12_FULL_39_17]|nr:MAG: GTP-binding protein YchF [Candidatus Levybacteria bacterium GW2011_GWA1_39_11]OGH45505.1 MAG: redox-regulated ATPase YchF [Candidatus Levybacteria bacterium RIFCSPLOWO2_02_FULL_39_26]OGH48372.1 MAG: redox-regulated ATPase YchF [Candidatus Levybacteria bacterium RIFCSPLOWO2_12_FULL_39_17]